MKNRRNQYLFKKITAETQKRGEYV